MAENPLAGLRVPSINGMADELMRHMGDRLVDLSNPLQRQRLRNFLEHYIGVLVGHELERAVKAATDKAIEHVFELMRDQDYQEKHRKYREARLKKRAEHREKQKAVARETMMDYSKKQIKIEKRTIN